MPPSDLPCPECGSDDTHEQGPFWGCNDCCLLLAPADVVAALEESGVGTRV